MKQPSKQNNASHPDKLVAQQQTAKATVITKTPRKKTLGQSRRITIKPVQFKETESIERGGVTAGQETLVVKARAPSRRKKGANLAQRNTVEPALLGQNETAPPETAEDGRETTAKKTKKPGRIHSEVTMSESEYELLLEIKRRCADAGVNVKKNDLFRIGLTLLKNMRAPKINAALVSLPVVKRKRSKTV